MISKFEVPRFIVLLVGVVLLVFTFFNAYLFLKEDMSITSSSGLVDLFGEALAPLVGSSIRVMYLAVMVWIGSIVTIRGVQLLIAPKIEVAPKAGPEAVPRVKPKAKRAESPKKSSKRTVKGKKDE